MAGIPKWSDPYQYNTLGYVEQKITGASTVMNAIFGDAEPILDEIRPISYDGAIRYIFEKRSYSSPASPLFQPIVLSEPRYNLLKKLGIVSPGHLGIIVKHTSSSGSLGMNPYCLTRAESLQYGAKIPLAFNKTFGYPIISISLAIKQGGRTIDTITIPEEMYEVKGGDLLLTSSLEDLAETSDKYKVFIGSDTESLPSNMYYQMEVVFHRFVPLTPEYEGLALAQVGHYAVMDQIHQYTFAEISSNMIAEIGYTEVLTMLSTLASAPAMIFYSYASFRAEQQAETQVLKEFIKGIHEVLFKAFVVAPISETIEELTIDVILEGLVEGYLREWGFSDNFGQWCSLIATSIREGVSLSNRIDSSIKHKSKAKFDLESKVGKIESQLKSQDLNSEQKQKLQDEKLGLESEIATLQQKIDSKLAIRDALKLVSSVMFAAASMGFGGLSLGGMSSLISTSYDQFVKEPLHNALLKNSKKRTIGYQLGQINAKIDKLQEKMETLDTDSKKYKDLEKTYYHLIYEQNQLNALKEQIAKASDISQNINSEVLDETGSIELSQQETEVRLKLKKLSNLGGKYGKEFNIRAWADYALSLDEVQAQEKIQAKILEYKYNEHRLTLEQRKDHIEKEILLAKYTLQANGDPVNARYLDMMGTVCTDPMVYATPRDRSLLRDFSTGVPKQAQNAFVKLDGAWKDFDTPQMRALYELETGKDATGFDNRYNPPQIKIEQEYKKWIYKKVTVQGSNIAFRVPAMIIKEGESHTNDIIDYWRSKLYDMDKIHTKERIIGEKIEFELKVIEPNGRVFTFYEFSHKDIDISQFIADENIKFPIFQIQERTDTVKFERTPAWDQMIEDALAIKKSGGDYPFGKDNPASPMRDELNTMRDRLMVLLNHMVYSNTKVDINSYKKLYAKMGTSQKAFEAIIGKCAKGYNKKVDDAGNTVFHPYFGPNQETIAKWEANIIKDIYLDSHLKDKSSKAQLVKDFFNPYYKMMGMDYDNDYYLDAYRFLYTLSAYLYEKGYISGAEPKQLEKEFSSVLGESHDLTKVYNDLKDGEHELPHSEIILKIFQLSIKLIQKKSGAIEDIEILDLIRSRNGEDWNSRLFSSPAVVRNLKSENSVYKESAFGRFLIDLVDDDSFRSVFILPFLEYKGIDILDLDLDIDLEQTIRRISKLLFGKERYIYQNPSKPIISKLMESLYRILTLSQKDLGYNVPEDRLRIMKENYITKIHNFIKNNEIRMGTPKGFDLATFDENSFINTKVDVFIYVYLSYLVHNNIYYAPIEDVTSLMPSLIHGLDISKTSSLPTLKGTVDEIVSYIDANIKSYYSSDISYEEFAMKNDIYQLAIHYLNKYINDFKFKQKSDTSFSFNYEYTSIEQLIAHSKYMSDEVFENLINQIFSAEKDSKKALGLYKKLYAEDPGIDNILAPSLLTSAEMTKFDGITTDHFKEFIKFYKNKGYKLFDSGKVSSSSEDISKSFIELIERIQEYAFYDSDIESHTHPTSYVDTAEILRSMGEYLAHEKPSLGRAQVSQNSYRYWNGKIDLYLHELSGNNEFAIRDFKPRWDADTGGDLNSHFINTFAQVIVYCLIELAALEQGVDMSSEEITMLGGVFNEKVAVEFDPKRMYILLFDLLLNVESSEWHDHLEKDIDLSSDYEVDLPDIYKMFFIDCWQIGDIKAYLEASGYTEAQISEYESKIEELQTEIGDITSPP